jgi:hypothetical protein
MKLNLWLSLAIGLAIGQIATAKNQPWLYNSDNLLFGLFADNSNSRNVSEIPDSLNISKLPVMEKPSIVVPNISSGDRVSRPWPTGALLRSAILPAWGQVYNKQYFKAVLYGGTEIALVMTTAHYWKQMDSHQRNFLNSSDRTYQAQEFFYFQNSRDNRNLFLWFTGLTFFISMFDAYVDAHFADFNQKDKAFEANLWPKKDAICLSLTYNLK